MIRRRSTPSALRSLRLNWSTKKIYTQPSEEPMFELYSRENDCSSANSTSVGCSRHAFAAVARCHYCKKMLKRATIANDGNAASSANIAMASLSATISAAAESVSSAANSYSSQRRRAATANAATDACSARKTARNANTIVASCSANTATENVSIVANSTPSCLPLHKTGGRLPDGVRRCLHRYLTPLDRMHLRRTCRVFRDIFSDWEDVVSLDICFKEVNSSVVTPTNSTRKMSRPFQRLFFSAKSRQQQQQQQQTSALLQQNEDAEPRLRNYHVRVRLMNARSYRLCTVNEMAAADAMHTLLAQSTALKQLTVWDACLTSEFAADVNALGASLETLRLWNCGTYFVKKPSGREKMIETMMALPNLRELLVMDTRSVASPFEDAHNHVLDGTDTTPEDSGCADAECSIVADEACCTSSGVTPTDNGAGSDVVNGLDDTSSGAGVYAKTPVFHKSLAALICAPLENIQLTNVYVPLRSMESIADACASTCTRLAIGCTFGKESKRIGFLATIARFKNLTDIDFPPFIFRLDESPWLDDDVRRLIETLPIISIGFRHYNSSVLFRFVETQLPEKILILRIHHNAHRVPYFADLGSCGINDTAHYSRSICTTKTSVSNYSLSTVTADTASVRSDSTMAASTTRQFKKYSSATASSCTLSSSASNSSNSSASGSASSPSASSMLHAPVVSLADRLRAIKTRLTNDAAGESGRRFTVGNRFHFAPKKKFSAANVLLSPLDDAKRRKHSLDCSNNRSNSHYTNGNTQLSYHNSSYSLDGRQATTASTLSGFTRTPLVTDVIDERDVIPAMTPAEVMRRLKSRGLTIFAIAEGRRSARRTRRIYRRHFCGVDVVYVPETAEMQEVAGRMASPMKLPYVYSKNCGATRCSIPPIPSIPSFSFMLRPKPAKTITKPGSTLSAKAPPPKAVPSRYHVVNGDIVRPIPLSSLGMESDYEHSDWEDA